MVIIMKKRAWVLIILVLTVILSGYRLIDGTEHVY